jgi:hypothetical protein
MSEKWINWLKFDIAGKKKQADNKKSFRENLKASLFPITLFRYGGFL